MNHGPEKKISVNMGSFWETLYACVCYQDTCIITIFVKK